MQTNTETVPQIAMYISESYMSQPPPAPWPPLPPSQAVQSPVPTVPPPPPPPLTSPTRQTPSLQTPISNAGDHRPAPTTYSALPPQTPALFNINQPPNIVPAKFDASRPPPPIPSHIIPNKNGPKRKIEADGDAGSSKVRKPDGSAVLDSHCENCAQREIRIESYKHQMESLHNEEETQILLYKKKLQEYEIGKDILKQIVGPELFTVFDNLIEGSQTPLLDSSPSFISGSTNVSKQTILQLFQMWLDGGSRNVVETVPSTSLIEETLTSLTRRHNVTSYKNTGPDLIKLVVESLRNNGGGASDWSPSVERPQGINNRTNGYLANGQKPHPTSVSEPARYSAPVYSGTGVLAQDYGSRMQHAIPNYSASSPSGYATSAAGPAPPPAGYPAYHPAVPPPPNRPYYGPGPAGPGPSSTNVLYNGVERAPGPGAFPGMPPPTSSAALRPSQANYNYMGRYPQPPYFPPYQ